MAKDIKEKRKKLILELFKDDLYTPMRRKELAMFMQVDESNRADFDSIIDEMLNEGLIRQTQRGKLVLPGDGPERRAEEKVLRALKPSKYPTFTGRYIATRSDFGFVEVEGLDEDFFVPGELSLNAFNNDTVTIEVIKPKTKGGRAEARVIKVQERANGVIVGTFEQSSKGFGFVRCDDPKFTEDIFIPIERSKGAVTGHKVVVELTSYGDDHHKPEGKVTSIIGHVNDPGVDILSIVLAMGLKTEFPEKVINQAERLSKPVSAADINGREDLRNVTMVTIDSEDAKDLDDAVSLEMVGDIYRLGVHIADVSNYVQENSALDHEAFERGTSVYLADRVIPMLPHTLSNGICSLNAGEDRLCLSCIMDIDPKGDIKDYRIVEGVINVDRRMSYTAVKKIIEENDEEVMKEYEDLVPMFLKMHELAKILRNKRKLRGAIDFDFSESKLVIDEEGHCIDIKPYDRNEATKLIEEFMLAANETVARHFYWLELPFLYRVHDVPDMEKMDKLRTFIKNFGYTLKSGPNEVHPKEIQKLLMTLEGTPEEDLIARLTLRSMNKACYSEKQRPHFGLACDYYCHFTSPIRRYPDLQIHRIIKDSLRGRLNEDKIDHYDEILPEVARKTSALERRADECERETVKHKKAEYMLGHIGEVYEGVISSVTNWGLYVELSNTVEGLVHVSSLTGDYYRFDENNYELVGEGTGRSFKLGERVKVYVKDVDISMGTVDFELYEEI